MTQVNDPCARCGVNERMVGRGKRKRRSYCLDCHAAYMRGWRPTHPLTGEARKRAIARNYAGVYKRRGKIVPTPCKHCGTEIGLEMHHDDYDRPTDVEFICREEHTEMHIP